MNINRILSIANRSKEHVNCRRQVIKHGLRPNWSGSEWSGHALNEANQSVLLSGLMSTQMARMIAEGFWAREEVGSNG